MYIIKVKDFIIDENNIDERLYNLSSNTFSRWSPIFFQTPDLFKAIERVYKQLNCINPRMPWARRAFRIYEKNGQKETLIQEFYPTGI